MATGAVLDLTFAGIDTIGSLRLGGTLQGRGTWGAVGSGAEYKSALLAGTGILLVTKGPDLHGTTIIVR